MEDIKKIMDLGHSQLQSQLRTVLAKIKMCELANSVLQLQFDNQKWSNDFQKEQVTALELRIRSLEDSREKLTKNLSDKDEKISHLEVSFNNLKTR